MVQSFQVSHASSLNLTHYEQNITVGQSQRISRQFGRNSGTSVQLLTK